MRSLGACIVEYRKQLEWGCIKETYRGIINFMTGFRNRLEKQYPGHYVSALYQGYMDITYFALTPETLKSRKLRIAVVFVHGKCDFEFWLSGVNKQVQREYWNRFKEKGWNKCRIPADLRGVDSIVEQDMIYLPGEGPDFDDPGKLMDMLETAIIRFTEDVVAFLSDL